MLHWISFLAVSLVIPALATFCDDLACSNINDYVCASVEARDGTEIIMRYQNICFLRRKQCQLRDYVLIKEIPHRYCNIKKGYLATTPMPEHQARRVQDFSIVGAHQACNHSCPTYCTDSYDPACAQIWKRNGSGSHTYRPMINHCHIDLFSCATGLNVTIQPLGKCYKNPGGLLFMLQVAALKSMHLLDDGPFTETSRKSGAGKKHLWDVVERVFEKILERKAPMRDKSYGRNVPLPKSKRNRHVTAPLDNSV